MGSSGVKGDALASYGTGTAQANQAYGTANPIYTQMATNPQGYTPQEKANMVTQGAQSLGGSQAGAVGQANLMAARTGNVGGYAPAIDASARGSMRQQSDNTLGVDTQDAALKRAQQSQGLSGLNGIYQTGDQTAMQSLGAANNAAKPFWQQALLQGMQSAGQAATGNLGG
jgi:hypothetical protein